MDSRRITALASAIVLFWGIFAGAGGVQAQGASAQNQNSFNDILPETPFYIPAEFLKARNIIQGYADGQFRPDQPVNRAEALAIILRATGRNWETESDTEIDLSSPDRLQIGLQGARGRIEVRNLETGQVTSLSNIRNMQIEVGTQTTRVRFMRRNAVRPFNDVSSRDWFYSLVSFAKKNEIVKGFENERYFRPAETINLAEALRILFKSSDTSTESPGGQMPPGINAGDWFANDMAYAVSHYLVTQQSDGSTFSPARTLNRGELALLIYRFLQSQNNISFGYASWYGDGLARTVIPRNTEYADRFLTAAHKTLPFGTIARVTNMQNGQYVDVVINDRGPFVTGRLIDLSRSAFSEIASPGAGVISVQIEIRE